MNVNDEYLAKFKIGKQSRETYLATQIFEGFHRRIAYPRLMKIIQSIGWQATFEAWKESTRNNVKRPTALFLWKCAEMRKKIIFK